MKIVRVGWWGCSAGLLLVAAAVAGAPAAAPPPAQPAPVLNVRTLDGKTFNLAAEHGKWVIVNFWATWCSPCLAEMPAISKYVAAHQDVMAIGLAYQPEPIAVVRKYVHKHPVDYPVAYFGMQHALAGIEPPRGLPETYLIAPDGGIAKHFIGPVNAKLLDAAIAAAKDR